MYDMTIRQFANAVRGYNEAMQWDDRQAWERMRMQTTALLQVHVKKNRKLKATDVFKFEWDEATKPKYFDEEHTRWLAKKIGIQGKILHGGGA